MSKFIPSSRMVKEPKENVLAISALARAEKEKDAKVINATIGSYYNEETKFFVYDAVKEYFKTTNPSTFLTYSSILGPAPYKESVIKWIFGAGYEEMSKEFIMSLCPTPGGTGAIALTYKNYLEEGDYVLLPDLKWPTYIQIAENIELNTLDYKLYDENKKFGLESLVEKIKSLIGKCERICIVINDPSHNPTGFVMKNEDYKALVEKINELSKEITITILFDIAYIDYDKDAGSVCRENFKEFKKFSDDVQILFAFSASKSFGIYGLRAGALVHLSRIKEESAAFVKVASYTSRAIWSNVSHIGMNIVSDILSDEKLSVSFKNELKATSKNLTERAKALIEILDSYKVPYAPYSSGFFVLVLASGEKLEKEIVSSKAYVCRMGDALRVAVSGISKEEAIRIGHIIGKAYQNQI